MSQAISSSENTEISDEKSGTQTQNIFDDGRD
jgi:hypothetical protein